MDGSVIFEFNSIFWCAEEAAMGVLMLKCPTTGREFSTGVHLEEDRCRAAGDELVEVATPPPFHSVATTVS
jgi:hypothetical protein